MVEQQSLFPMEELTFSQEEHPARTSPSPDSARARAETMVSTEAGQGPLSASTTAAYSARYNPGGSSMRMCRVCLPPTRDGISPTSSWHWDKAGTRMSRGEFLMLNMSEWTAFSVPCRRDGGVCGLSDILEPLHNGLRKYFLSRIGCEGFVSGISPVAGATVHPCYDNLGIGHRASPGGEGGVLMLPYTASEPISQTQCSQTTRTRDFPASE